MSLYFQIDWSRFGGNHVSGLTVVATRPWSPSQAKTREVKLCNHKRKIHQHQHQHQQTTSESSQVQGDIIGISNPGSISSISLDDDSSPVPIEKSKSDGLKRKRRKLGGSSSNLYSGVSVSQLLAQRDRAIAAAVAANNANNNNNGNNTSSNSSSSSSNDNPNAGSGVVSGATVGSNPASATMSASNGSQVWPVTMSNLPGGMSLPHQTQQQQQQLLPHQQTAPQLAQNQPVQRLNNSQGMATGAGQGMIMGNQLIMNQQANFGNLVNNQQSQQQQQQQHQQMQQLMNQQLQDEQTQEQLFQQMQQLQQMQLLHDQQTQQQQQQQQNRMLSNLQQPNYQMNQQLNQQLNQQPLQQLMQEQQQMNQQQFQNNLQNMSMRKQQQNLLSDLEQQQLLASFQQSQQQDFLNQRQDLPMQNHNLKFDSQQNQNQNQQQIHNQLQQLQQQQQQLQQQQVNQQLLQQQQTEQFQMQQQLQQQQQQLVQSCGQAQYQNQMLNQPLDAMQQNGLGLMNGLNDLQVRQHQQQQFLQNQAIQSLQTNNNNNNNQFQQQNQLSCQMGTFNPVKANNNNNTNLQQFQTNQQQLQSNQNFNVRAPPWQQQQQNNRISLNQVQTEMNMQNCNAFNNVQHMPQDNNVWTEEVARKKAKTVKNSYKKFTRQQQQLSNNINNCLDQNMSGDEFSDKLNSQSGPSFLEDPSGYLAQQTALLNSTISRQTGVTSTQQPLLIGNQNNNNNATYLPQPKPSSLASPSSLYSNGKNNPNSPVFVHSSMTPNSAGSATDSESGSPMSCQRCVTSADTQSLSSSTSSTQDSYKQRNEMHRHQYSLPDMSEDPISSTFGEKCMQSSCQQQQQQQLDSRPIQGGTVSTSHGSPIGTNSPANSDTPTSSTSQPPTPQSLMSSQPSTPHAYSQPATPHMSAQHASLNEQRSATPSLGTPCETVVEAAQNQKSHQQHAMGNGGSRSAAGNPYNAIITTMASGHTVSSNTITSVLAGRANTATVSMINAQPGLTNAVLPNVLAKQNQNQQQQQAQTTVVNSVPSSSSVPTVAAAATAMQPVQQQNAFIVQQQQPMANVSVSKSPLEMVQSVVSSIQVPQVTNTTSNQQQQQQTQQQHQQQQQQANVQVHNVLTSSGILKQATQGQALPPGHILVSNNGQLIMASTGGVMAPPPPKINSMPPLSVSPMVTNVTGTVSQVIPAVGVAQQVIGQPTVLVNTIQTPVIIQPSGVMTMDSIGQNVQIPHLTVTAGNVLQNAQPIIDAANQQHHQQHHHQQQHAQHHQQDVARNVAAAVASQNLRQQAGLPPEPTIAKKKVYKKRKSNTQTVASMLHIAAAASSQQNAGMLMQSHHANFAQQNFQTQSLGGPMLQALTIVPGKNGGPAQLVMNGQPHQNFNTQQIITNAQPAQQINLLQPVNLLNGTTGMVQNFPTIQQFIVPGLGSMVMSADGTATLLQDTGNIGGMQLQLQNVNGQNVLTPVQNHGGIFGHGQSILAAGPAGMVIRAPQATGGKIIQAQASPGTQFISQNSGQFLVNGATSFGNQLNPIVANVSPNQQVTFNATQVRPSNIQGQQEFIQMNGQTLMVPCATAQNIATVSSSQNQQNTTFVQQNTTIVQQQTTMQVSNNQLPGFQAANANATPSIEHPSVNINNAQYQILASADVVTGKGPASPKSNANPQPSAEQAAEQQQQQQPQLQITQQQPQEQPKPHQQQAQTQQFVITNDTTTTTTIVEKSQTPAANVAAAAALMVRQTVSTQTNQANAAAAQIRQGSPPDTTTHSPGNSQRSNSPAVDTTTHGAASPPPATPTPANTRQQQQQQSSTPMVHCVSSSEPDSGGDAQLNSEEWRGNSKTVANPGSVKEMPAGQPASGQQQAQTQQQTTPQTQPSQQQQTKPTFVESSTASSGIQIFAKQADGAVSTVRCEGRGLKRKLDSIQAMHSTLHEDQDEPKDDPAGAKKTRVFAVGEVVWGAARGNAAWPGKIEALGPRPKQQQQQQPTTTTTTTTLASSTTTTTTTNNSNNATTITNAAAAADSNSGPTVWIRWYGSQREAGLSQVAVKSLQSLSEGLEAHHRSRKKFRKSRKLNTQLENAIQEAMAELDSKQQQQQQPKKPHPQHPQPVQQKRQQHPEMVKTRPRERLIAPLPAGATNPHQQQQHQQQHQSSSHRTIGLRKTPGRKVPQVALVALAPAATTTRHNAS